MWMARPEGGTCVLKQSGPPLQGAALLPLRLDDGSILRTYRLSPYAPPVAFKQLQVNLGWTLLDYAAQESAEPGGSVIVSHVWRVDALPDEPHASWYFAPFVSLIAPDGRAVAGIDGAAALEGWAWQQGALMFGSATLTLPVNLPPGDYVLRSTLFDPNQKKNAVYFDPAQPGVPILALTRTLRISP